MELLALIVIGFAVYKLFFGKKKHCQDKWPDEQVEPRAPKKKGGCMSKLAGTLCGFCVVVLLSMLLGNSWSVESTPVESPAPSSGQEAPVNTNEMTPSQTAVPTPVPTAAPTSSPTPEPATLQEWAEHVAQEVYGSFDSAYRDLISVSCEQVDGESAPMITINVKYPSTFLRNNDERMSGFLFNVMNVNWKLADLAKAGKIEYGSVLIHGRTMFADQYGNETECDASSIRIKASEAEKVNWSLETVNAEMMPGIAVSFGIHPVIREGLSVEYYNNIRK